MQPYIAKASWAAKLGREIALDAGIAENFSAEYKHQCFRVYVVKYAYFPFSACSAWLPGISTTMQCASECLHMMTHHVLSGARVQAG